MGVLPLTEALSLARQSGVDLVEVAPTAVPPVCRVVDFGKYRYEIAKREKESKKHQHATTVKEVQLSPRIDPHDLSVKLEHSINFLCEDMKVKIALRFRGREMAHTEFGFEVVKKFIADITPWGHPDFPPKLLGRSINVMISPLPRNKRAKNPHQPPDGAPHPDATHQEAHSDKDPDPTEQHEPDRVVIRTGNNEEAPSTFVNNPFDQLNAG